MIKRVTVNVPTVLEQKLFGTSVTQEIPLSRKQLQSIFFVGRKLELIAYFSPMKSSEARTIKAHKSYGYLMEKPYGRESTLRFEIGDKIFSVTAGDAIDEAREVKIRSANGEIAAHYKLL